MSDSDEMQAVVSRKLHDMDLIFFANLVNRSEVGVALTLFISGTLITGSLISGKKYYAAMQDKFVSYDADSYGAFLKEHFSNSHQIYDPEIKDVDAGEEASQKSLPLNFIHLENVSFQTGSGAFTALNGGLLRLKIEEVDGYILGSSSN
ncbi:hypothetical protein [Pantoea agglomerans]|uniref:hypothetical protein n=1 Tax=Enterobacter agglomerans TaxID=549 RepID=UPI00320A03F8